MLTTLEPECEAGVDQVAAFAEALGARVLLAGAPPSSSAFHPDDRVSDVADVERELLRMRLCLGRKHPELDVESRALGGRPWGWPGEESGRASVEWLAVVTRRSGCFRNRAQRAGREAIGDSSVPVLLIDGDAPSRDLAPGGVIAVAYDFGPASDDALDHALVVARRVHARVRLVFVYPGAFELDIHPDSDRLADVASAAQVALQAVIDERDECRVELDFAVRFGRAAHELADEARSCEAELLVVGRHAGHGAHRFTSALAEDLLRIAPCPLLVVPASRGSG